MEQLYTITPRIVAADTVTEIAVSGKYPHTDLRTVDGEITVDGVCADGLFSDGILPGYTCFNGFKIEDRPMFEPIPAALGSDGVLRFKYLFRSTGEHTLHLRCGEHTLLTFSIFSIPEAWLKLRPYRCDLHLHSGYSGCCRERAKLSPEYFAALLCASGLDFISISDHKQHTPSLIAANFVNQCGGNFRAYSSEEVHLQDLHTIHVLNFGGDRPVSDQLHPDDPEYVKLLNSYLKKVPQYADYWLRHLAANWHIAYDKIREAGGLMVYCHPFWRPFDRRFLPECIRDYIFEHRLYDALEVFGEIGDESHREDNELNVARYHEQCIAEKRSIPVVGNSDIHQGAMLNINSSIVWAERNELKQLQNAILDGMSIAVKHFPSEFPRTAGGNLTLVNYYHFLRKYYYPHHDEICKAESREMLKTLSQAPADYEFVKFINRPGHITGDTPIALDSRKYTPDTAAMARINADRAALDGEFWKN